MAEVQKKPVKIVETVLRDAHQSLLATRMTTDQMLPIVDKMDKVGYHAVECWGGATFDACLRFLKEDPWERLRKLRAGFKNTKLSQMEEIQKVIDKYDPNAILAGEGPLMSSSINLSFFKLPLISPLDTFTFIFTALLSNT